MDVRLPDGTILQGVPDGMSKADLVAKLKSNGYDTSGLEPKTTIAQDVKQGAGNFAAGLVRGAGSIGATLLAPVDMAARALNDGKPVNVGGFDIVGQDRRTGMDAALGSMGAETDSLGYGAGKLTGEIAGTAGAGGSAANALTRVAPRLAAAAPGLVSAIRTGGMTTGTPVQAGAANVVRNLAARGAGGAVTGGIASGMVNPEDAVTGAAIGGAAPVVLKGLGALGQAAGRVVRGPEQSQEAVAAIKAARDAGYVIPPTQASPTLSNRLLEGFAGKLTTAQNASAKNAEVTNKLASKALGLAPDAKITPEVLQDVRKVAGQAYSAIGQSGVVTPGKAYMQALDDIAAPHLKASAGFPGAKVSPVVDLVDSLRSNQFDASSAVEKIKELRSAADDAFRTGNTDIGRASKSAAKALEDVIEAHLQQTGNADLLAKFRDARQLIAKTYSVEKALNPTTGTIDAKKLGSMLEKGKPISGELKQIAEFSNRFPKAVQTVERMGSLPQTSPLDWAAGGAISAATSNPLALAGVMARPGARALTLSDVVQNRLVQNRGGNAITRALTGDPAQQLIYRAAPVAATSR